MPELESDLPSSPTEVSAALRDSSYLADDSAALIAFLALYLAHGIHPLTTVALLGTLAALVLGGAGPLAHHHQVGVGVAHAKDAVLATGAQAAAGAVPQVFADLGQTRGARAVVMVQGNGVRARARCGGGPLLSAR